MTSLLPQSGKRQMLASAATKIATRHEIELLNTRKPSFKSVNESWHKLCLVSGKFDWPQ